MNLKEAAQSELEKVQAIVQANVTEKEVAFQNSQRIKVSTYLN